VARYFERWIKERKASKLRSAHDDDTRLRKHAMPIIGSIKIEEARPRHIRDFVRKLKIESGLAPRTIHHVYGTLHTMFKDAVVEELILANPCVLRKGELPKKVDKDPLWRSQAIFTRSELEQLISDPRIAIERRIFYALLFLTGARFGEISALRWSRYHPEREPLGCLIIAESFDTKHKTVGPLKTEIPREVPVHAVLAELLAEWKLRGWHAVFGRHPGPDDLLIPYPPKEGDFNETTHWRSDTLRKALDLDCQMLGGRHRRTHDSRRTLISLARADGAQKDILKWATHGRPEGIIDAYSEFPWETLCAEFQKLKINLRRGQVIALPQSSDGGRSF
jgi:integrase